MTTEIVDPPVTTPAPTPPPTPSLMSQGQTPTPPAPPAPTPVESNKIPDKYVVKNEDGSINYEASSYKIAEAHSHLERRLGSGDVPPKTVEDYAPEVPEDLLTALKADPMYQAFLKGAHARGINNKQLSYVLEFEQTRQTMARDPAVGEAELRKVFTDDASLKQALSNSYRAARAYAGGDEAYARLDAKFGNDPDWIQVMARIGATLGEDRQPPDITQTEVEAVDALLRHPGYLDRKHPEHTQIVAKVRAHYSRKHPQ